MPPPRRRKKQSISVQPIAIAAAAERRLVARNVSTVRENAAEGRRITRSMSKDRRNHRHVSLSPLRTRTRKLSQRSRSRQRHASARPASSTRKAQAVAPMEQHKPRSRTQKKSKSTNVKPPTPRAPATSSVPPTRPTPALDALESCEVIDFEAEVDKLKLPYDIVEMVRIINEKLLGGSLPATMEVRFGPYREFKATEDAGFTSINPPTKKPLLICIHPAFGEPGPLTQKFLRWLVLHECTHAADGVDFTWIPPPRDHGASFKERFVLIAQKSSEPLPRMMPKAMAQMLKKEMPKGSEDWTHARWMQHFAAQRKGPGFLDKVASKYSAAKKAVKQKLFCRGTRTDTKMLGMTKKEVQKSRQDKKSKR